MIQWVVACACLLACTRAHGTSPLAQVAGVEHSVGKDSVRVVVRFNGAVSYVAGTATDPFRLYFDVRGARPAAAVSASSTVGDVLVKRVRLGQYQPGITRIVLDLTRPAPYTTTLLTDPPRLLIEVMRSGAAPSNGSYPSAPAAPVTPVPVTASAALAPAQMPPVPPQVKYQNGLLTITALNSTLYDVLQAVAACTNATLDASPALMGQRVAVALGPAPPREVLADLLQGMDYVLVGSSNDPKAVRDIILHPSSSGLVGLRPTAAPGAAAEGETASEETPGSASQSPSPPPVAGQATPAKTPEEQLEEVRRLQEEQSSAQSR